jgi:hypothetical protein
MVAASAKAEAVLSRTQIVRHKRTVEGSLRRWPRTGTLAMEREGEQIAGVSLASSRDHGRRDHVHFITFLASGSALRL